LNIGQCVCFRQMGGVRQVRGVGDGVRAVMLSETPFEWE
jgi:hypothetical protein